ncbi:MAG: thioredoxin family protein [Acidobacteria bacterium]|nr:thioredoxin family protein [Acidobacteriota bacterium]MDW7984129.1 thioredoxin family protein [Acidobacteriota bacterium]
MALISSRDAEVLRKRFAAELRDPVDLWVFTQVLNCPTCPMALQIAQELGALTDKIRVVEKNPLIDVDDARGLDASMVPAFVLRTTQSDGRIRYYGLPSGYEFSVLVETLVALSRQESFLEPELVERLQALTAPMTVRVFVTPTCPYCPQMAFLAYQIAMVRPNVTAEVIEASEFPEVSTRYQVRAVPRTVVNDRHVVEGSVPPEVFIEGLLQLQDKAPEAGTSGSSLIIVPGR